MILQSIELEDDFKSIKNWKEFLENQLEQYWLNDIWVKTDCPLLQWNTIADKKPIIYSCNSTVINTELKFGVYKNIISGRWQKKHSWKRIRVAIPVICRWLNQNHINLTTFKDLTLSELEELCKSFLIKNELYSTNTTKRINSSLEIVKVKRESDIRLSTLRIIYKEIEAASDVFFQIDPFKKDVWDLVALNACGIEVSRDKSLNFNLIHQNWLKEALKKYFQLIIYKESANGTRRKLTEFCRFSIFLNNSYPVIRPQQIEREIIVNFLVYLNSNSLSASTINKSLGCLNSFFSHPQVELWLNCHLPRHLIYPDDYLKIGKTTPRYIPEEVEEQIKRNLDGLRQDVMRMVLMLLETGRRATEILYMPFDCLVKNNGYCFLRHPQFKMNDENSIPISEELANVISEQQKHVIENWGSHHPYLFPGQQACSNGKPLSYTTFNRHLKKLIIERDIRDKHGQLYNLTIHQFRHSVGTSMVNNGVPLHIIQRYLGHTSPEMTLKYAYIHDETLRKEITNFHKSKTIDITGQIVSLELESDSKDLEWFTKEIAAVALPNGYCGRPKILGDCDIAGDVGCYLCPFFRTNKYFLEIHKDQLGRINQILNKAYRYGWKLPIKKNEPIKQNLELIINALEEDNNE